jgi:hypothetical protein
LVEVDEIFGKQWLCTHKVDDIFERSIPRGLEQ